MLQCVAVCCSVMQPKEKLFFQVCGAVWCSIDAVWCSIGAVCCSVLHCAAANKQAAFQVCIAVRCSVLKCAVVCCSVLQCAAARKHVVQCGVLCCSQKKTLFRYAL